MRIVLWGLSMFSIKKAFVFTLLLIALSMITECYATNKDNSEKGLPDSVSEEDRDFYAESVGLISHIFEIADKEDDDINEKVSRIKNQRVLLIEMSGINSLLERFSEKNLH